MVTLLANKMPIISGVKLEVFVLFEILIENKFREVLLAIEHERVNNIGI